MNMIVPERGRAEAGPNGSAPPNAIVIAASHGWRERLRFAVRDMGETMQLWSLVWTLSLFDIRLRYRGSLLGPFWLTLSTAVMIGSIGFLYARLFHQNVGAYLPFLTISVVLWNFINTVVSDGAISLVTSEGMIRSQRMPHSLHAARVVMRNILVLGHNLIVIAAVFAIFHTVPSLSSFSVIPASMLWVADAFALSLFLGLVGARFRDIPPIVGSIMQIAFYLTPIMWSPGMLEQRGIAIALIKLNPFYSLLEILRAPLLGQPIDPSAWIHASIYSTLLIFFSFLAFARARPRIPYWI